jgi:hypothetical protein
MQVWKARDHGRSGAAATNHDDANTIAKHPVLDAVSG